MCEKRVTERVIQVGGLTKKQAKEQLAAMRGTFLETSEYYKTLTCWITQD